MRDLKTLYELLLGYYISSVGDDRRDTPHLGYLCNAIVYLHKDERLITKEEQELLFNHFRSQKPTEELHSDIYKSILYRKLSINGDPMFNWYDYDKDYELGVNDDQLGINIRIALIESIISNL